MTSVSSVNNSLLSTVQETANAVTGIVTSVSSSIEILNSYVARHRILQVSKNKVELNNYNKRLLEETTLEIEERKATINTYLAGDANRIASYNETYNELAALLA